MKFKIINMLVILGMLSVMPLIYMGKIDPMALYDSLAHMPDLDLDEVTASAPNTIKNAISDEKVQVYRWRDENGVMQFSSTPPQDALAERVELDPNSNIMQAVSVEKIAEPEKKGVTNRPQSPYTARRLKKVMDDAKDVESLLKQRHEQQQEVINKL